MSHANWSARALASSSLLLLLVHSGRSDDRHDDRASRRLIVGGKPVQSTDAFPAFAWSGIGDVGWGCGGALIHPDVVLTAAHCEYVFNGSGLYIGATKVDGSDGKYFIDEDVRKHPEYDDAVHQNDVMLVKLDEPSDAIPFEYNADATYPKVGADVSIVGFGVTSEGGSLSRVLREVSVGVYSQSHCAQVYLEQGEGFPIDDNFICAGTEEGGRDACDSDSGSPLLIGDTVVAVVGDGIGCARPGMPSTNARVSEVADWIERTICEWSSVPPESCGGGHGGVASGTVAAKGRHGRFATIGVFLAVACVAAFVVATNNFKRSLSRQDSDSYEMIPEIDSAERR